ncbi:MAG TPA: Rrf2 family transcriptional regulator [Roseiflexaceae bacterium]|nr:Rrf2 family transcriptional regulator [Roseiflexaceae bacterium]HMP39966.1 Rrf2 family transcriptional regulator [Roseiflexaceae bacterium]
MRISSKGEYGLRALLDLALHYGEGPIQSRDIHVRQAIDENYLNQILIVLRRAGLIESVRGPQGGHRLARQPDQITVLEAVVALEGPLLPIDSGREGLEPAEPIDREVIREMWHETRAVLEAHLGALTIEELSRRKRGRIGEVMYYI